MQLGLSINDLKNLTIGFVMDMMTEAGNDDYPYQQLATQEDYDNF